MGISTHVLDTAQGRPVAELRVGLSVRDGGRWEPVGIATTDADGRVAELLGDPAAGTYRLRFEVGAYLGADGFYPEVTVVFRVVDPSQHYHVPLLLSPFGYSTYRGS
ncbi:MAG: hydroxyisourate hydrolase [Acidimicrobiales bacterium]